MSVSDERVLQLELIETKFTLLKVSMGIILGTIFGLLQLRGGLFLLIALAIIPVYALVMRMLFKGLAEVNPLKLVLWDGTISYIISVMVMWTLVYNLISPIIPPS